eukprot:TRINITY_DN22737_c0_g2_i3.p1 TRINITY_DN22737_c0_g2~~TRINITY_DN22737_c0_g2_i3.p1  ORF type:complete len:104 (-),score=19.54 TRINITY_DN22737_c0_g2_i3:318-629(-)
MQLPRQCIENLPRGVSHLDLTVEEQGASIGWVPQVALDDGEVGGCHVFEDPVEVSDVVLGDCEGDFRPEDGGREGEADAVGDDDGDAAKGHRLHQPRAPWGPP